MAKLEIKSRPEMRLARAKEEAHLIKEEIIVPPALGEFAKGRKFLIKTFGCQGNVRDEETMAGLLSKAGFTKTDVEKDANVVIINTCAVRENAEEKIYGEIGKFKANKAKDKDFILCICGCVMQEEGVAEKIMKTYPYVSCIFGTHNIHELLNLLDEHIRRHKNFVNVLSFSGDVIENLPAQRSDPYKAFVNISYGCDKFCTYCIVPYTRGRERSRPMDEILAECKELVEKGYKEITLLGQNVNSYGKDFKNGTSFANILEEVAKLGIPRLRFMTSHPWDFTDEMLDVIAKYDNIMNCIHLPVQSGNTEVLRRMGRRYTREQYLDLVNRIKTKIPGCALTTDIIVGFPNETEEEFTDTLTLCQEVKYDAAFTFIYSPRKGTPAANIEDHTSDEDKHIWFNRLLKAIEEGVVSHSSSMVGKTYKVLVDGPSKKDETVLSGYTESSKLVNFKGPAYLKGEIVDVLIKEDHAFSMIGELVEDPVIIKAKSLKKEMDEEPLLKEFSSLSNEIDTNEGLVNLRKEIEDAQKEMTRNVSDNEKYMHAKARYIALMKQYEEHPLIVNYKTIYEEVSALLGDIAGRIL